MRALARSNDKIFVSVASKVTAHVCGTCHPQPEYVRLQLADLPCKSYSYHKPDGETGVCGDEEKWQATSKGGPKRMLTRSVLGAGIVSLDTHVPGKKVAVVCNVHGNEPCGRAGLQRVLDAHELRSGSLVIIDANPEASLLDQRYVSADLNRMFTDPLLGQADPHHDLARAQYLSKVIPDLKLDYAMDIHSTSSATQFLFAVGFGGSDAIMGLSPTARISG